MGPAEVTIRSRDGQKQYLVISYRRGGEVHRLKVPVHFSTYAARSPMYIKHPYGKYLSESSPFTCSSHKKLILDRYYLQGYNKFRLVCQTVNICRENSLASVVVNRHYCRISHCEEKPINWHTCPKNWCSEK